MQTGENAKMIRYAIACAMLALPASALAQTAPAPAPVTVEVIATGEVTVPAQRFRISAKIHGKGETEDAAKAALAAHKAKLLQTLSATGVREAQPGTTQGDNSFMSLFASMAGHNKPTVSMDSFGEDQDAKPEATASETIQLDAPTRAAAGAARKTIEADGGAPNEEVIGLLDDYPSAARKAKADALVKARTQAAAYGEALGLRTAAITRISEKQDIVGGTMGFIAQIVGMFAPKSGTESNDVTVRETLTVEFKLSR
ncbi:MAG: DUF541 domain-containing protein [Sphingomonadales bacterium]|nr:MAG: DUF541 domain-containing protein [Sphingomonadales bacterium]